MHGYEKEFHIEGNLKAGDELIAINGCVIRNLTLREPYKLLHTAWNDHKVSVNLSYM